MTVTHTGLAPVAGASFEDDLSAVLDDATFDVDSIVASAGTATYDEVAGTLSWTGDLGINDEVTITYSVTVKNVAGLEADGDARLTNVVTTDGQCVPDHSQGQNSACTTEHPVGWYVYSKTSAPGTGSSVEVGDEVIYTVEVTQRGQAPVVGASLSDDLSNVFDNAEYQNNVMADNNDADADPGTASIDEWLARCRGRVIWRSARW